MTFCTLRKKFQLLYTWRKAHKILIYCFVQKCSSIWIFAWIDYLCVITSAAYTCELKCIQWTLHFTYFISTMYSCISRRTFVRAYLPPFQWKYFNRNIATISRNARKGKTRCVRGGVCACMCVCVSPCVRVFVRGSDVII